MATSIESGLVGFLLEDPAVVNLIGQSIGPWSPQGGAVPRVTYKMLTEDDDYTLNGPSNNPTVKFEIHCWAKTQLASRQLSDTVRQSRGGLTAPNPQLQGIGSNGGVASIGGVLVAASFAEALVDREAASIDATGVPIACEGFTLVMIYYKQ